MNYEDGAIALPQRAAQYMKLASPKAVKLLLYAAANRGLPDDPKEIDRSFTADDVEEAVGFWKRAEVFMDDAPSPARSVPDKAPKFKTLMPSEIAARMDESPDIRSLFGAAESIYCRPLKHDEQRTLIWIHDHLDLPSDVTAMLIGYAHSAGKGTMAYIERVAIDWCERGICTLDAADEELIQLSHIDDRTKHISGLIHVARFTAAQQDILSRWDKWAVSDDMIVKASDLSIEKKGAPNISYMDGIIKQWHKDGITTPEQADRAKEERSTKRAPATDTPKDTGSYAPTELDLWLMRGYIDEDDDNGS